MNKKAHLTSIKATDIPQGSMQEISIQKHRILLINQDNRIHALDAICPHEEIPLCNGFITENKIQCPLHGSQFYISTGIVINEPAEDNLLVYRVELINGYIQVYI